MQPASAPIVLDLPRVMAARLPGRPAQRQPVAPRRRLQSPNRHGAVEDRTGALHLPDHADGALARDGSDAWLGQNEGSHFAREFALYVNFSGLAIILWTGKAALRRTALAACWRSSCSPN